MTMPEFEFEFYNEVEHLDEAMREQAEQKLRDLAEGHTDMIGASVAVEEIAESETTKLYQARVIAFIKPKNVVGVEKDRHVEPAIRGALEVVERQIRQLRDKKRKPWQQR